MKESVLLIAALMMLAGSASGQFAPPAGQPGTTAMHKDSSAFVDWGEVVDVTRGPIDISNPGSNAFFGQPGNALGIANGGVVSLGDGGSATFTMDPPVLNGTGPDFAVFENSFSDNFLELAFVEVSSDGTNFFRFEAISNTDTSMQVGTFGLLDATKLYNLAGKYRALFGTPFDLEELANTPGLDVDSIRFIRIVDVVGSVSSPYATYDANGHAVNDPWPTPFETSGFDLDALGVIHQQIPTGVNFPAQAQAVRIFPNPLRSGEPLQVRGAQGIANADWRAVDLAGRLRATSLEAIQALPAGSYILTVPGREDIGYRRLVVIR